MTDFNPSPFAWARWKADAVDIAHSAEVRIGCLKPVEDGDWFSVHARFSDAAPLPAGARAGDGIPAALAKLDEMLGRLGGCTDGGCLVVRPKGMHTNGGCKCLTSRYSEGPIRIQHFAHIHNEFVKAVRATLAAAPAVSAPAEPNVMASGWTPIHLGLPPKFVEVQIAFAGSALPSTGQFTGNKRDSDDGWSYPSENSGDDTDWTVTHWRPLPEHPEAYRFAGSPDAAAQAAIPSPVTGDAA